MELIPCLITKNSAIYSFRKKCCLTALEHLAVQGLCLYPALGAESPLKERLSKCSDAVKEKLAGNTMHAVTIGVFLARCLSLVERRPPNVSPVSLLPNASDSDAE